MNHGGYELEINDHNKFSVVGMMIWCASPEEAISTYEDMCREFSAVTKKPTMPNPQTRKPAMWRLRYRRRTQNKKDENSMSTPNERNQ